MTAIDELAAAVVQWLAAEPGPRSRAAIRRAIARRGIDVRAAISMLLADPSSGIVEVAPRVKGACRVWTRAAAERTGLHVIERPGAELAELATDAPTPPADEAPPPPPSAPVDPPAHGWGNDEWDGYGY